MRQFNSNVKYLAQHQVHDKHLIKASNNKKNKSLRDMLKNIKSNKTILLLVCLTGIRKKLYNKAEKEMTFLKPYLGNLRIYMILSLLT